MKNISLYFKCFVLVTVFFASCTTTESKVKALITEKENRVGNIVKEISLINMPAEKKSLFTVNYTITTPEETIYHDSIQVAQTQDEIFSEFVWTPTAEN